MHFPFNLEKAIAAASVLLRDTDHKCMEYLRLLKLLYIADREALRESDAPILGARVAAMRNGPVHSRIFNLIKGEDALSSNWQKTLKTHGYLIQLVGEADTSQLSKFEVRKLKEVTSKYREVGTFDLVDVTHEFPEWKLVYPDPNENTSRCIEFESIVEAVGCADDLEHLRSVIVDALHLGPMASTYCQPGNWRILPTSIW